ncbi:MAG: hypothetical protein AVDCRST_MAG41-4396 [uncultured Corynebacteriales bacterium]|uniref:Uncharacterized protein n=1 Tax=uncultured Mycobacteriales bacterium TaxID=581187 RepID=A0A6J4JZ98_9ACTN|nr:MAG: hypothetical protein AVDCRST_MAG41-4396 [uncultured Corynebacteriales bacterium]
MGGLARPDRQAGGDMVAHSRAVHDALHAALAAGPPSRPGRRPRPGSGPKGAEQRREGVS